MDAFEIVGMILFAMLAGMMGGLIWLSFEADASTERVAHQCIEAGKQWVENSCIDRK